MYLKLALHNAKRSLPNYILYIFSMVTLITLLCISNCLANWANIQAGFQTMALPLLIILIMVVLVIYINVFIVRQRAKEFATYMLLGMPKKILSLVFLCELSVIGLICFLSGIFAGMGIFSVFYCHILRGTGKQSITQIILKSNLETLAYFSGVEILSFLYMKRRIWQLEIVQLMGEKQRNQRLGPEKRTFWGRMLIISYLCYMALLSAIAFWDGNIMTVSISFIFLPMTVCVFSFYKWLYAFTASLRLARADFLYRGNRLYGLAQMTSQSQSGAVRNTVFSICIIFSAVSFAFGLLLFNPHISVFEQATQQWLGISQISICIIFMTICFFINSFLQIMDRKQEYRNIRLLFYMGKNRSEIKALCCAQTLIWLFLPTLMSFVMLFTATPFINYKLNGIFPESMNNLTVRAMGGFMLCFFALYGCYFCLCSYFQFRISCSRSCTRSSSPSPSGS